MVDHESIAGAVCWFCGHGGAWRTKSIGSLSYRACDDCKNFRHSGPAEATREAVKAALTADLHAIEHFSLAYKPQYWTPAQHNKKKLLPPASRAELAWKAYHNPEATVLHEAKRQNARNHQVAYRKERFSQQLVPGGWASKTYKEGLWINYKLTTRDFERMWEGQEGKCPGCSELLAHPYYKELKLGLRCEIDHRHIEGQKCQTEDVRGLLCRGCNQFLGKVKDNIPLLQNLAGYLKRHGDWK